jgi:thioesterase domain-containing protein
LRHPMKPRLYRLLEDVKQANLLAHNQYIPQPYPGPLAMFRAKTRDTGVPDSLLGWRDVAENIEPYEVSGDHVSMIAEPHLRILAEQLKKCLDRSHQREAHVADQQSTIAANASG